jgi:uncharacterized protein YcnI
MRLTATATRRLVVFLIAAGALAVGVGSAWAHARISPAVVKSKDLEVFSLAVPTEKENAATTKVELTLPEGFSIDSFVPSPGWTRQVQQTGSGESAVIQKVTWSGGHVPTGEDAFFQFLAVPSANKAYTFAVRQTYSDGSVVDWSGPESSDSPAPVVEARSSLGGGGGGSSTLEIVALVVGALGLVIGGSSLLLLGGKRPLA